MSMFSIRVTYETDTQATSFYRLSNIAGFIKKHPLKGKRGVMPVLPWLLDLAFEKAKKDGIDGRICKIEIKEC